MGHGHSVLSEPSNSPFPHLSYLLEASCLSSPVSISGHKSEATCSQGGSGCGMAQAGKSVAQWLDLVAHAPPGGARLISESVCPLLTPPQGGAASCGVVALSIPNTSLSSLGFQTTTPGEPLWLSNQRAHEVVVPPESRLDPSWSLGRKGRAPAEGSFEVF